jgi:hypothetical protein
MSGDRLYRGQSKKYREEPFIPSALRISCIKYMEIKLSQYGIETKKYKQKCKPNKILKEYCNNDYKPPLEAFYAYWLSLVNCALAVNENPICFCFCQSYVLTKNPDKDKIGTYGLPPERIAEVCFNYAKDFFDTEKQFDTFHLQLIMHDYAFFQHFNHALSKLNKNCSIFFPTLTLDWTWDKSSAERFADTGDEKGTILSISWDAYKKWNPTKNFKACVLSTDEIHIPTFGFESYKNYPPWNEFDWHSQDNNLMIEQDGAVIFWPWKYTIDQLKSNLLGKEFDFTEIER